MSIIIIRRISGHLSSLNFNPSFKIFIRKKTLLRCRLTERTKSSQVSHAMWSQVQRSSCVCLRVRIIMCVCTCTRHHNPGPVFSKLKLLFTREHSFFFFFFFTARKTPFFRRYCFQLRLYVVDVFCVSNVTIFYKKYSRYLNQTFRHNLQASSADHV